jgi:hypothetical protein
MLMENPSNSLALGKDFRQKAINWVYWEETIVVLVTQTSQLLILI